MSRSTRRPALSVWMNGERVGLWQAPMRGSHSFLYEDSWPASPHARPISLTMPLRSSREPYRTGVEAFFENLLPDSRQIRERIQRRYRTRTTEAFDLLAEVGRDCVGALQLLPEEAAPANIRSIKAERLSPRAVGVLLDQTLGRTELIAEEAPGFRISLAGAQEKTALLWHDGAWHRPLEATPTTHIIKLPIGPAAHGIDLSASVENEWLCSQILRGYGVPVAENRIARFGEHRVLVVERFDRRLSSDRSWWQRLPQEDLCQATGTPPAMKYESDGGPGIVKIMDLLRGSDRATEDRRDFLRTQLIFWLLAAIDGHAKNFSLFLLPGGGYQLTPRYDVLSAHPVIGHGRGRLPVQKARMAMAVHGKNRHYHWAGIEPRHWIETARRCGFSGIETIVGELVDRTPDVLTRVADAMPGDYPAALADAVFRGVRTAAGRLTTVARKLR